MPRRSTKKERGVFEKDPGSEIRGFEKFRNNNNLE